MKLNDIPDDMTIEEYSALMRELYCDDYDYQEARLLDTSEDYDYGDDCE